MENIKKISLAIILLIALTLCATAVMKLFDLLLGLEYENLWTIGFKVGFLAWMLLIAAKLIQNVRCKREKAK